MDGSQKTANNFVNNVQFALFECPSSKHISLIVTVVSLISQLMTVIVDEANQCFNGVCLNYAFLCH